MDDALFDAEPIEIPANNKFVTAPLAARMRPSSLDEVVGQPQVTRADSPLSGFKGKTKDLLIRAELIETDGFSVVAATNVTQPSSTPAKSESC